MGIPEDIALFEQRLNELVIKYEQYFLGLEKREPLKLLESVEQLARKYANIKIVNTMLNFKYNSLVSRFNSYRNYWNRILRLIEEGKYSRERFRMTMHANGLAAQPVSVPQEEPSVPQDTESLFQQFIAARKSCNLPTESLTKEKVLAAIEKQKPALFAKYGCEDLELRVVVENGVPRIKARPRRNR